MQGFHYVHTRNYNLSLWLIIRTWMRNHHFRYGNDVAGIYAQALLNPRSKYFCCPLRPVHETKRRGFFSILQWSWVGWSYVRYFVLCPGVPDTWLSIAFGFKFTLGLLYKKNVVPRERHLIWNSLLPTGCFIIHFFGQNRNGTCLMAYFAID
jgi:hypothetical protein